MPLTGANFTEYYADEEMSFQERIARRAFELWRREGCPDNRETDFWLEAQRQLLEGIPNPDNLSAPLD